MQISEDILAYSKNHTPISIKKNFLRNRHLYFNQPNFKGSNFNQEDDFSENEGGKYLREKDSTKCYSDENDFDSHTPNRKFSIFSIDDQKQ